MLSYCLSLCSINQTCAGIYYDETKSMCYISEKNLFINIPREEHKAYMKAAHGKSFVGLYSSLVSKQRTINWYKTKFIKNELDTYCNWKDNDRFR